MSPVERPDEDKKMLTRMLARVDRELPLVRSEQDALGRKVAGLARRVGNLEESVKPAMNEGNGRMARVEATMETIMVRLDKQDATLEKQNAALQQLEDIHTAQTAIQKAQKEAKEHRITTNRAVGLVLLTFLLSALIGPLLGRWLSPVIPTAAPDQALKEELRELREDIKTLMETAPPVETVPTQKKSRRKPAGQGCVVVTKLDTVARNDVSVEAPLILPRMTGLP